MPGQPKSQGRPRVDMRRGIVYSPGKANKHHYKTAAKLQFEQQGLPIPVFESGAVEIKITYRMSRPLCHYRSRDRTKPLCDGAPLAPHHTGRPDIDNLDKLVLDSLTGIAYKDDCQVADKQSKRMWDSQGGAGSVAIKLRLLPKKDPAHGTDHIVID